MSKTKRERIRIDIDDAELAVELRVLAARHALDLSEVSTEVVRLGIEEWKKKRTEQTPSGDLSL